MITESHTTALIIGALAWIPCALFFVPLFITKPKDEDRLKEELQEKKKDLEKLAKEQEK